MLTPRMRRTALALGACLVAGLLVTACGGGDDSDSDPDIESTATESADEVTDDATIAAGVDATDDADEGDGNAVELVDNGDGVACPLVTTDQVSDAIETPMSDGVGQGGDDAAFDTCTWNAESGPAVVNLDFFKRDAELYYGETSADGKTDVSGIGEKARWSENLSSLEVLEGDYFFAVYVQAGAGATPEDNLAAATLIATDVVESLS